MKKEKENFDKLDRKYEISVFKDGHCDVNTYEKFKGTDLKLNESTESVMQLLALIMKDEARTIEFKKEIDVYISRITREHSEIVDLVFQEKFEEVIDFAVKIRDFYYKKMKIKIK